LIRSNVPRWLSWFVPAPLTVKWPERLRAAAGALLGIAAIAALTQWLLGPSSVIPMLIAPMGASAVLLFAVPASPLAQPWSLLGGNLVSAAVGVACASWIADPALAAAMAVAGAIAAMLTLRCAHPPSGAVALTAVLGGPAIHALGYRFVLEPVLLQSLILLAVALAYHALTGHRYPHVQREPAGANAEARQRQLQADLDTVLQRQSEFLAVDPADLAMLLRETQRQAYARSFGELKCADIMSSHTVSVSPTTTARTAAALLRQYDVKALPVIDAQRRVIGIVTRADLMGAASTTRGTGPFERLLARRAPWLSWRASHRQRARTIRRASVGTLMASGVRTVGTATPIVDLVPQFAAHGHHHIPVVDANRQLAGIITPTDLIAGLYRQTGEQLHRAA
jgi:CBS domain-containing membrane protein